MSRLVIVSNRVPAARDRAQLAGGLAIALRDAIAERETLWFGWSGNEAATETSARPTLSRTGRVGYATIDLAPAAFDGFYRGFSNTMLWPLLHNRVGLAEFKREDLAAYLQVNESFATALAPLLQPDDTVWVHDYHLFPLGASLRRLHVRNRIGFFLHVPFPPPAIYASLPQGDFLLRALGEYDVIGLQTEQDAGFLNEALAQAGVKARATAFPIGIDPEAFAAAARRSAASAESRRLRDSLAGRALILGVDRLDYSKGLPLRFLGFERLLKRFPEHRNHVTLLQVAPVSRADVEQYQSLRKELDELAGRINGEHAEFDWVPLRYITRTLPRTTLAGFHRYARVGLVTPLRDGMNLVAKEYVAAQDPASPGALVLSCFAGAAHDMQGAILVNPYDPDETAEALHQALTMEEEERRSRWRTMWTAVTRHTARSWARNFLAALEGREARAA